MIQTNKLNVKTSGENNIVNITKQIQELVWNTAREKDGYVLLFLQSTTSALIITEYENGILLDIPSAMEKIAPKSGNYEHEKAYRDGNGHSHVRSSILGVNITVPFQGGKLLLGTWQQIVAAEFDIRPRTRTIIVQVISE